MGPLAGRSCWLRWAFHVCALAPIGGTFGDDPSKTPDFLDQFDDDSVHQGVAPPSGMIDGCQAVFGQSRIAYHDTNIRSCTGLVKGI